MAASVFKNKPYFSLTALAVCLLSISSGAFAQTAGSIIKEVNFVGVNNALLTQPSMQYRILPTGKNLVGKSVTDAQIEEAAVQMSQISRNEGLVVSRVLVTPADKAIALQTGVLKFTVLEGVVGKVNVINTSKVNDERLVKTLASAVCSSVTVDAKTPNSGVCDGNQVLQAKAMERATLLVADLPGVQVSPIGLSGKEVGIGQTAMAVKVDSNPNVKPVTLKAEIDNYGARSVGTNRLTLSAIGINLLGNGDVTSGSVTASNRKLYSGNLNFSAPIYYSGLRGNVGLSKTYFTVDNVKLAGHSEGITLGLSHPLARVYDYNLKGTVNYNHSTGKSTFGGSLLSDNGSDTVALGLSLDDGDKLRQLGQSYTQASIGFLAGRLKIQDLASQKADALSANNAGSYSKVTYSVLRKQNLTDAADGKAPYALLNVRGQMAEKNLAGGEKMTLGGISGVRAYPADEPSADQGNVLQMDIRQPFQLGSVAMNAGVFFDVASVKLNAKPWTTNANRRTLKGYGVGLDVQPMNNVALSLLWAKPVGSETSITDPTKKSRVWVGASAQF